MPASAHFQPVAPYDNPISRLVRNTRSERNGALLLGAGLSGFLFLWPEELWPVFYALPLIHLYLTRRTLNFPAYLRRTGIAASLLATRLDGTDYAQAFRQQYWSAAAVVGSIFGLMLLALAADLALDPGWGVLAPLISWNMLCLELLQCATLVSGHWFLYWGLLARGRRMLLLLPFYMAGYAVVIVATLGLAAFLLPVFFWTAAALRYQECQQLYPERLRQALSES